MEYSIYLEQTGKTPSFKNQYLKAVEKFNQFLSSNHYIHSDSEKISVEPILIRESYWKYDVKNKTISNYEEYLKKEHSYLYKKDIMELSIDELKKLHTSLLSDRDELLLAVNLSYGSRALSASVGHIIKWKNLYSSDSNNNKLNTISLNLSHQKIIYGAPGTGKSHYLSKIVEEHFQSFSTEIKVVNRVTFYDGYSYGQFVGTYKPVMYSSDNNTQKIGYEYVPGPLLLQILNAYKYPNNNFILIIEEINRSKPDRVFGDIFQLLDRNSNGDSEYPIFLSREQDDFFKKNLDEEIYLKTIGKNNDLYLPSNLYIWATMNSSDQGVYPMDTAFKRRWDFEYIPLNKNTVDKDYIIQIDDEYYSWSLYRNTLNDILGHHGITEDRLISPFFLKNSDFDNETLIIKEQSYINKFLMYIFDDILKHNTRLKEIIFIEKTFYKVFSRIENKDSIYSDTFMSLLNDKKNNISNIDRVVKNMEISKGE